jgi:hypothetical protein
MRREAKRPMSLGGGRFKSGQPGGYAWIAVFALLGLVAVSGCLTSNPPPACLEDVCWLDPSGEGIPGIGGYPILSGPDGTFFEWTDDDVYFEIRDRGSPLYGSIVHANLETQSLDMAASVPGHRLVHPVVVASDLLFFSVPEDGPVRLWSAASMAPLFPSGFGDQYLIDTSASGILWEQDGDGDEVYLYDLEQDSIEMLHLPPVHGTTDAPVVSYGAHIVGEEVWVAIENRTGSSFEIWSYREDRPSVVLTSDAPIEDFMVRGELVVLQGQGSARVVLRDGSLVRELGRPGAEVGGIHCDGTLSACAYSETVGDGVFRLVLERSGGRWAFPESSYRGYQLAEDTLFFTDESKGWRLFGLDISKLVMKP